MVTVGSAMLKLSTLALALVFAVGGVVRLETGTTASFRGVSAAPDGRSVWASGTAGTVLKSQDGTRWLVDSLPTAQAFDLRGIVAVGGDTAYAMVSRVDMARIYKTIDGGEHWALQYDDTRPGVLLDGIAFWDSRHGIALGDPIDGAFLVVTTDDGGATWTQVASGALPAPQLGEAAFAASNTALVVGPHGLAWFATGGGVRARVFRTDDAGQYWTVSDLPIAAGDSTSGAFSLAFRDAQHGLAVGGDYAVPDSGRANVARTDDGGRHWHLADSARTVPYVSAVMAAGGDTAVATGPRGTFLTVDWGTHWQRVDSVRYNAVAVAGDRAILVGPKGSAGYLPLR
jgi:photosystem II stability/assembly factor-like uncharacterized protein